jgi:hypothetical protein
MRILLLSLVVFVLGLGGAYLVVSPGAGAHSLLAGTITGSVGTSGSPDAYEIALSVGGTTVAPGQYEFDITDYASIHNFDLCRGAKCTSTNSIARTSVGGTGSVHWIVSLTPGTYTYQCDVHSAELFGQFTVPGTPPPPMNVQITKVVPKRALVTVTAKANQATQFTGWLLKGSTKLATTATTGNRTAVTLKLKPLKALKAGSYVVQVRAGIPGAFKTVRKKISVM